MVVSWKALAQSLSESPREWVVAAELVDASYARRAQQHNLETELRPREDGQGRDLYVRRRQSRKD